MSELEVIAAAVDAVGGEIGTVVQQLTSQAQRCRQTATQATAATAGSSDPRPRKLMQQLAAAADRCDQAAQSLQHAESAAKQFVGRVIGDSGGSRGQAPSGAADGDLDPTRPYFAQGGLRPPSASDLSALTDAVSTRFSSPIGADGETASWVRLGNDGGVTRQGRANNCVDCSLAAISTWFGHPSVSGERTEATGGENGGVDRAEHWLGGAFRPFGSGQQGFDRVEHALLSAGPGAAACIWNGWISPANSSHVWNAFNVDGTVVWVDTQSGTASYKNPYARYSSFVNAIILANDGSALW